MFGDSSKLALLASHLGSPSVGTLSRAMWRSLCDHISVASADNMFVCVRALDTAVGLDPISWGETR